jgi:hypothetical protein
MLVQLVHAVAVLPPKVDPWGGPPSPPPRHPPVVPSPLQGPGGGQASALVVGGADLPPGQQKPLEQQQQRERDALAWQELAQLLSRKTDRINHLKVIRRALGGGGVHGITWCANDNRQTDRQTHRQTHRQASKRLCVTCDV